MSYSVHNFRTGDVIEAPPINEIDTQVALNAGDIETLQTNKANKSNPAFTGSITLGSTTLTEEKLSELVNMSSATGVNF